MSHNFRLFLSGATFPEAAWQSIMDLFDPTALENRAGSLSQKQWMTKSQVWVTLGALANTRHHGPPWARWCVTLDFAATPLAQCFDATSLVAFALAELPRIVEGIRLLATDAFDYASAETVHDWARIAGRYLDEQAVAEITEWAVTG